MYRFEMTPVPLERIDLLDAVVCDHNEVIRDGVMPTFGLFETVQTTSSGDFVMWRMSDHNGV
ncbi:hypothetical protein PINS_up007547 [Pythium insidiosum]|nr:hypothetical protein PINS_up007547 [Pythium insidiosum]